MSDGPETTLVKNIRKAILREHPDAWFLKVHGGGYQNAGLPDLLVCVQGMLIGIEVKAQRPGESLAHAFGRASLRQQAALEKIRRSGAVAGIALSIEDALGLIGMALEKVSKNA